jgi:uroporphyrin-3 C-methyltransferase
LAGVRQAISDDIARLQGLATVDTIGISARLDELLGRVDKLPLAMEVRPQPGTRSDPGGAEEPLWKRLLRETWEELKQLVRIQRMDRPDIPLLAPSQAFFLRENLKLRLLGARLGLLARDMQSYKADLGAARDWLQRYYDVRNDAVARDITMLSNLHAAELSAEVPDISASLEAMRGYRRARADATQKP